MIHSFYFLQASTSDFYRVMEDTKEGEEEEILLSFEELKQKLCSPKDFDSFYIINQEAKVLTAMNLIDGILKSEFDLQKAVKERVKEKGTSYDYIMIGSKKDQIYAKYFSINQKENDLTLSTKEISLPTLNIYEVAEESAKNKIEDSPKSSFPISFIKKDLVK